MRQDDCTVLKEFLRTNSPTMDKLLADSKTAQVGGAGLALDVRLGGCGIKAWRGMATAVGDGAGWPTCLEEQR